MNYTKQLAYKLRSAMYINNISIKDISNQTHLSNKDVNRLIKGRLILSPTMLNKVCEVIGISVNDLLR